MKATIEIQFQGKNVKANEVEKLVKEDIKANGVKINTVDTLEIYYAPDKASVYYVATTKSGEKVTNTEPLAI